MSSKIEIQGTVVDVFKEGEDLVSLVILKDDDQTETRASLAMSIKHDMDLIPIRALLIGKKVVYSQESAYDEATYDLMCAYNPQYSYNLEILSGPAKGNYHSTR